MTSPSLALHERLQFDLADGQILDGPRRYVIMRADVLMGAFERDNAGARQLALTALGHSVTRFGGDSVRAYLAEVGPQALLQAMVEGSASLGWGVWAFREEVGNLWLEVRNSPFAAGSPHSEQAACHPIAGMLRAVAQALWSQPVEVRELQCACQTPGQSFHCLFLACPQAQTEAVLA
jgi:predicted hydrocarbon binding protein